VRRSHAPHRQQCLSPRERWRNRTSSTSTLILELVSLARNLQRVPSRRSQRIRVRDVVNPEMPAPRRWVFDCGRRIAQAAAGLLCDDANVVRHRLLVQPPEEIHPDALRAALLAELHELADAGEQHHQPRGPHHWRAIAGGGVDSCCSSTVQLYNETPAEQQQSSMGRYGTPLNRLFLSERGVWLRPWAGSLCTGP
jgi:hypothetical protein